MSYLLMLLLSVTVVHAVEVSEQDLLKLATDNVPKVDEIKSKLLESQVTYREANDELNPMLNIGYNHLTTKEKAIISFMPVYSPVNQYKIGVSKSFKQGLSAELSASVDQRSGQSAGTNFKDIHTTIYAFTLNLDLWKNLFGKLTKRQLENAELQYKSSKIQSDIELKAFKIAVRRVYYNLLANNEKSRISKRLYDAAKRQAKDARERMANSIADAGEVARYESQVASREGSLLYLDYERETLLQQLRNLLPQLSSKEVSLASYNLNKSIFEVLECTSFIDKQKTTPYQYTQYDEMTALLKQVQSNRFALDKSYDDIDVKLSTTFKQTGVASDPSNVVNGQPTTYTGSYEDSLDDIKNNNRSGFEAGLQVTIPFGETGKTSSVKEEYSRRRMNADINSTNNNVVSTHQQISKSVKILADVIRAQKVNSEKLQIRLKDMQKKYNQARIPVNALIQDQDALFSSELTIIDTQLAVVNTLLDYLVIFTETPCSFNRI